MSYPLLLCLDFVDIAYLRISVGYYAGAEVVKAFRGRIKMPSHRSTKAGRHRTIVVICMDRFAHPPAAGPVPQSRSARIRTWHQIALDTSDGVL
jgi:hypothetical protein